LNEKVTKKFGKEWKKSLLPLLDRFICAFDGEIDCLFWNSMVKRGHGNEYVGGYSFYHGWINILFPYMKDASKNEFNIPYSEDANYVKQGLEYDQGFQSASGPEMDYPVGLATAPVKFNDEAELAFLAGFIGYKQDEKTLEITPNVGWCIYHSK